MTQEEKEKLLLKDLAARVPYDIIVEQTLYPSPLADKEQRLKSVQANNVVQLYWYKYINEFVPIHCIKPYLRSLSSMTEEEDKEWRYYKNAIAESCDERLEERISELHDWFNAHYFDYRGLIPMGLALEAPEGMYNIN